MRKKDKLYTVNKFNKPLFMKDENIFDYGGPTIPYYNWNSMTNAYAQSPSIYPLGTTEFVTGSQLHNSSPKQAASSVNTVAQPVSVPTLGVGPTASSTKESNNIDSSTSENKVNLFETPTLKYPTSSYVNWSDPMQSGVGRTITETLTNNFKTNTNSIIENFGKGPLTNGSGLTQEGLLNTKDSNKFFSAVTPSKSSDSNYAAGAPNAGMAIASAAGPVMDNIKTGDPRGAWDTLDPVYHLAGGRESKVGNGLSDAGVALTKSGNPWLMLAGAGLKIVGGLTNAAFGIGTDKEKLKNVSAGIAAGNNYRSNASSFEGIKGPTALFSDTDVYSDGWFTSESSEKNRELEENLKDAKSWMDRSIANNVMNISDDQLSEFYRNYSALGGPIETMPMDNNMSAINYGFMSDYLATKKKQAEQKNQMNNLFMGTPKTMFDLGGDVQMHGGDYSNGTIHIDAGGTHEMNPNDGVQMGTDAEGVPNLVEEGEVVFNDYVYSQRINLDDESKKKFHLPKKKDITFADAAKKLEKESVDRPNDPISTAGLKAMLDELANQQERQKQEMEAERAKAAFEALSPEEQTAIMQRAAQEEAMAQQAAMQQETMAQQQAQPSPEEQAMMQQQIMQADGSQAMVGQEAPMMAKGGNLFDKGGEMKKLFYKLIGVSTDSDYKAWLKKNNLDELKDAEDWENILDNKAIMSAATKGNPALAHAIENKYDFGLYKPGTSGNISFDDDRGNWDAQTVQGWWGSNDPAWKQVIETHPELTEDTNLTKEQLAEYLRNTDAFKRGTQWLQNSEDNRLAYLQRIINNPNAPKRAKEYAMRFADANGWKQNAARDYETIFNNPSGRAANPGTYWKTPIEAVRGSQTGNFVINDDGTVEPIIGDVPKDWTGAGNYSWATPENDMTYNYYRRPAAAVSTSPETPATKTPEEEGPGIEPTKKADWMRYAGLFGPAVGLGMMSAGIGRPDFSDLNAAVASGSSPVNLADAKYLGDYMRYTPLDRQFHTNQLLASSRATDRALLNSSSPAKAAGLLANGYNTTLSLGNLARQSEEFNREQYERTKQFNRGTNQYNADAYNRLSQFNAEALNRGKQYSASLALQAAKEKMDADAGWYNSLYGNIGSLFKGISDLGRENRETSWRNALATAGAFGVMDEDALVDAGIAKYKKKKAACGGKIKKGKKRGITF